MKRLDLENNKIYIGGKEKGRYLAFSLLQDRVKIYKDSGVVDLPYNKYDVFAQGTQRSKEGEIITEYKKK